MKKKARRVPWYPTQANTGLEWGTQPSLPVRQAGRLGHEIYRIEGRAGQV